VNNFLSYLANRQTKKTNKKTKSGKNVTSLAEVIKHTYPVDFQKAELKLPASQELYHFVLALLANLEFSQYAQLWLLDDRSSDTTKSLLKNSKQVKIPTPTQSTNCENLHMHTHAWFAFSIVYCILFSVHKFWTKRAISTDIVGQYKMFMKIGTCTYAYFYSSSTK